MLVTLFSLAKRSCRNSNIQHEPSFANPGFTQEAASWAYAPSLPSQRWCPPRRTQLGVWDETCATS